MSDYSKQIDELLGQRPTHRHDECHQACPVWYYDERLAKLHRLLRQAQIDLLIGFRRRDFANDAIYQAAVVEPLRKLQDQSKEGKS